MSIVRTVDEAAEFVKLLRACKDEGEIAKVIYPGLISHPQHERTRLFLGEILH